MGNGKSKREYSNGNLKGILAEVEHGSHADGRARTGTQVDASTTPTSGLRRTKSTPPWMRDKHPKGVTPPTSATSPPPPTLPTKSKNKHLNNNNNNNNGTHNQQQVSTPAHSAGSYAVLETTFSADSSNAVSVNTSPIAMLTPDTAPTIRRCNSVGAAKYGNAIISPTKDSAVEVSKNGSKTPSMKRPAPPIPQHRNPLQQKPQIASKPNTLLRTMSSSAGTSATDADRQRQQQLKQQLLQEQLEKQEQLKQQLKQHQQNQQQQHLEQQRLEQQQREQHQRELEMQLQQEMMQQQNQLMTQQMVSQHNQQQQYQQQSQQQQRQWTPTSPTAHARSGSLLDQHHVRFNSATSASDANRQTNTLGRVQPMVRTPDQTDDHPIQLDGKQRALTYPDSNQRPVIQTDGQHRPIVVDMNANYFKPIQPPKQPTPTPRKVDNSRQDIEPEYEPAETEMRSPTIGSSQSSVTNLESVEMHKLNDFDRDLLNWLKDHKLSQYFTNFQQHGFDLISLRKVSPEDLNILNIMKAGHRKKILTEIAKDQDRMDGLPLVKPSNVFSWLNTLRLGEYESNFIEGGFDDIEFVRDLDRNDLEMIDIKKRGHQNKLLMAVQVLSDIEFTAILDQVVEDRKQDSHSLDKQAAFSLDSQVSTVVSPSSNHSSSAHLSSVHPPAQQPLSAVMSAGAVTASANTADNGLPTRDDLPPPSGEEYMGPQHTVPVLNGMKSPQTNGLPSSNDYTNGVITNDVPPSATSERAPASAINPQQPPQVKKKPVPPPPKPKPKPKPRNVSSPAINGSQSADLSTSQDDSREVEEIVTSAKSRSFWRQQSISSEQDVYNSSSSPSPTNSMGRRPSVGSYSSLSSPSPPGTIKRAPPPPRPRKKSSITDEGFLAAQDELIAAEQEFIRSLSPAVTQQNSAAASPSPVNSNGHPALVNNHQVRASPPVFHQPPPPTSLPPPLEKEEEERMPPSGSFEELASTSSSLGIPASEEASLDDAFMANTTSVADESSDMDLHKSMAETEDIMSDINSMIADFDKELDNMFDF